MVDSPRHLSDYRDAKIQNTMYQALNRMLRLPVDSLNPVLAESRARSTVSKLVDEGCNESELLQWSLLVAFFQFHKERNRLAERGTKPADRRLGLVGVSWTRRYFFRQLREVGFAANLINDFLTAARMPGGDIRNNPDVLLKFKKLPDVLFRYDGMARTIAAEMDPVWEMREKKRRYLTLLVQHIEQHTGEHRFSEISTLIAGWRDLFPCQTDVSPDALRKYYGRAESEPDQTYNRFPPTDENVKTEMRVTMHQALSGIGNFNEELNSLTPSSLSADAQATLSTLVSRGLCEAGLLEFTFLYSFFFDLQDRDRLDKRYPRWDPTSVDSTRDS